MANVVETNRQNANDFSLESRYGCHGYGALAALAIICVLILGCVPVFLATKRSSIIFSVIVFTIILIGVIIYFYNEWQRRRAQSMHAMCEMAIERVYVTDIADKKQHLENMNTNSQLPIGMTQLDNSEIDDASTVSYKTPWVHGHWAKSDTQANGKMPKYTIV